MMEVSTKIMENSSMESPENFAPLFPRHFRDRLVASRRSGLGYFFFRGSAPTRL